jgi:hypothetical protein
MADIAINPVTRRVQFTGNTGTGPFAFTFNILQASDVVVYKNNVLQTLTTDYTVTINANGTGSITMVSALVSADVLIIIGGRELSRTTDFVTSGDLLAASLNEQLDSNVIMSQQLDERISRAVRSQPGDELMDLYLPLKADRASKVLGFTSDGDVTVSENTLASIDLAVSSFVNSSENNAGSIFYDPAGSGATRTTVQAKLRESVSLKDFGAVGDGVTDDTAAIKNWLESGSGFLYAPDGVYLVAAAGANAGGVNATISESITVFCSEGAVFKAGTNLDNDIILINASASGYTATRNLSIAWSGGKFDQRLQRNSTVVPFSSDFPPANLGASATTDGLSIRGVIYVSGTPTAGFERVTVKDVETLASDQKHWENAGGDSGIFIDGAVHIHVSNVSCTGNRDLGIYASGLPSGAIPGGSCYIGQNKFYGCMFGASTKRLMSNVQIVNNIGYNTAVVANSAPVTSTGDNVMFSSNIGYGAWRVVRVNEGSGVIAFGNQSFDHGHLLQDGSVPTAVFNADNACVSFEGVTNSQAYGNRVVGLNTGFTGEVATIVLQDNSGVDCSENMIHQNTADGVHAVVSEKSGESDKAFCWGNHGRNLTGQPVVLTGASSIDRDGPIYETVGPVTHTGTTSSTVVATATIKQGTIVRRDRLRIVAAGTISGTANTKLFALSLGTGVQQQTPNFSATVEGNWYMDAYVEINSEASQRMFAQVIADTEAGVISSKENQDFDAGDIDIDLLFKLGDTADTMVLDAFSVRLV